MAAVTELSKTGPEAQMTKPLSDCRFFRYSLLVTNAYTWDVGPEFGVVEWAMKPAIGSDTAAVADVTVSSAHTRFTFAVSTPQVVEMLLWVK